MTIRNAGYADSMQKTDGSWRRDAYRQKYRPVPPLLLAATYDMPAFTSLTELFLVVALALLIPCCKRKAEMLCYRCSERAG